jgi:hypothetical protein
MVRASAAAIVVLVSATALTGWQAPGGDAAPDLKGRLYKSVFFSGPGALAAPDLPASPPELRTRLERYLARRAAFASRLQNGASSFESARAEAKKRIVERAIVALVDAPGIEQAAAAYAQGARVLNDWQKQPEAPLSEASAAEDFLKKDPSVAFAPYLYVFIAERQRAAFELMNVALQKAEMTAAAKKYRTFMQRARSAGDPIFRLLADDMDREMFLYVKGEFHPRDFDPDT